ncbi:MAG: Holliday junction resolvase RuvX [Candidatus Hinthialibacter antarcticus]|nr:Holliday junction resolvase RuvX [Candidatus Hinthialibacter antarcticus]
MTDRGRILGLDLGSKRVGVALSDALRITAQPFDTLEFSSVKKLIEDVLAIIERESVCEVVVGLPKKLSGAHGDKAVEAKAFAKQLRETVGVPVHLWDERFSTHAAQRALLEGNVRRKKRKQVIDKTAAAWILQGYLDSKSMG